MSGDDIYVHQTALRRDGYASIHMRACRSDTTPRLHRMAAAVCPSPSSRTR